MTAMKQCFTCRQLLPVSYFTTAKRRHDGLSSSCRACKRAYDSRRYAEQRGRLLAQHKDWRDANEGHIREYRAQWNSENREHVRSVQRAYDQRNADRIRARRAARRIAMRGENP